MIGRFYFFLFFCYFLFFNFSFYCDVYSVRKNTIAWLRFIPRTVFVVFDFFYKYFAPNGANTTIRMVLSFPPFWGNGKGVSFKFRL